MKPEERFREAMSRIETYIEENGQEIGTVSGQMVAHALEMARNEYAAAVAAIRAAEETERDLCCAAICSLCAEGKSGFWINGEWWHEGLRSCRAAPIHRRKGKRKLARGSFTLWEYLSHLCNRCGGWIDGEPVYDERDTEQVYPFCSDLCLEKFNQMIKRITIQGGGHE